MQLIGTINRLHLSETCHDEKTLRLWTEPWGHTKGTLISALCGLLGSDGDVYGWWGGLINYFWRRPQKQTGSNWNSKLFSESLSAITWLKYSSLRDGEKNHANKTSFIGCKEFNKNIYICLGCSSLEICPFRPAWT